MSAVRKKRLSVAEYLTMEKRAAFKSEFYRGEMFAMAGASIPHNRIKDNTLIELGNRLKGTPCRTYSSDQRVLVEATGLYTYPDILVVCGPEALDPADKDTLTNPTAIVEILSPSTERYVRGAKFRNYQQMPSFKEYILIAQDEAVCERFVRQTDQSWALVSFVGLEAVLKFTSIAAEIPLADIYAGVTLPDLPSQ